MATNQYWKWSDVAQGSVLRPLLDIISTNDLDQVPKHKVSRFAVDPKVTAFISNNDECISSKVI